MIERLFLFLRRGIKVIDNTLTVSSPDPPSLSLDEGDPLTLTCQASSNTVQHTHLSVTWYLHMDGEEPPQRHVALHADRMWRVNLLGAREVQQKRVEQPQEAEREAVFQLRHGGASPNRTSALGCVR